MASPGVGLPPERLPQIQSALVDIENGLRAIELAERAGIDVSIQKASLLESQTKLLRIKQVYFPGQ